MVDRGDDRWDGESVRKTVDDTGRGDTPKDTTLPLLFLILGMDEVTSRPRVEWRHLPSPTYEVSTGHDNDLPSPYPGPEVLHRGLDPEPLTEPPPP